jgi:protein-tyrosine-phosphatase
MAEVLLRHHLQEAGVTAHVSSAGLYEGGRPATAHGVETMAERGLDLHDHVSQQMDSEMLADADLVIAMAREHVREAAVLRPDALAKTFTLKELVRGAGVIGARTAEEPLADWLARISASRSRASLVGTGHDDSFDVEDPVGRDRRAYEVTADLLDDLLAAVVELAFSADSDRQERTA